MKLTGKIVRKGEAHGKALVSEKPISFLGGIDPDTGKIIEADHPLKGESIKDKVLVFPHGKGSTVGSFIIYQLALNKKSPAAMINRSSEPIVAAGAIIADIPLLHRFDEDPIESIETGDLVTVKDGKVKVEKQ